MSTQPGIGFCRETGQSSKMSTPESGPLTPTTSPPGELGARGAGRRMGRCWGCRLVTALTCWLLLHSSAAATPSPFGDEATLRSVTFIDADRGWCVGDFGVILRSEDSGRSWQPLDSSTVANLSAIGMFNSQRGLVIGGWYEPHTQIGRGTVLLTDDGGETWRSAAADGLPPLRHLLLGPRGQCVAVGEFSPLHATNVFASFDGGQTWEPSQPAGAGAAIALAGSVDDFLVLSDQGELSRVIEGVSRQVIPPGTRWTTVAADGELRLLSGPQATMVSSDRGETWKLVPAATNEQPATPAADTLAAACLWESELWSIGAAGTTISRRDLAQPAGSAVFTADGSLRAIRRLDADRGWAVGDWGTIVVTRDGGRTWRTVRGGQRRAAVLAVARTGDQLPWSLLAVESQQHLRRVAIVTGDHLTGPLASSDGELLLRDAAKLVGPTSQHRWDGTASGTRVLLQGLAPVVIVLDQALSAEEKSLWTSTAIELGVRRVMETGRANGQIIHYAAPLPDAGKLAGDVWTDALWLLRPGTLPPDRLQLGARYDSVSSQLSADGLASCVGNDRRYVRQTEAGTSRRHLQVLQARAGEAAWVQSLVESAAPLSERMTQFDATLPRLPEQDRQRLVFRVITAAKLRGKHDLYRAMLSQAADRWPDEPLGRLSALHVQAIDTSEEWQRMTGAESFSVATAMHAVTGPRAVQLSPFQSATPLPAVGNVPAEATVQPSLPSASGVQLAGGMEDATSVVAPAIFNDPSSETVATSAEPPPSPGGPAARILPAQSPRKVADLAWQLHPAVLLASHAANQQTRLPPTTWQAASPAPGTWAELLQTERTPAALHAVWAAQRPLLDGRLDEPLWAAQQSFTLATGENAQLAAAYDADFIYLAVHGPMLDGQHDSGDRRQRDTPLDRSDRYVIRIDVDGDLLTAYELEFDAAGNTRDTCDGFTPWQPKWFLAVSTEAGQMMTEIAIKRSDLIGLLQDSDRVWNISLQRRPAGFALPALTLSQPEHWRRLIFD